MALALDANFGSVDRWRAEFDAMGKALGGGSGWVLLTFLPRDGSLVNQWAADHTDGLPGGIPILALDMYEHACHLDYGAAAGPCVDAFMARPARRNVRQSRSPHPLCDVARPCRCDNLGARRAKRQGGRGLLRVRPRSGTGDGTASERPRREGAIPSRWDRRLASGRPAGRSEGNRVVKPQGDRDATCPVCCALLRIGKCHG